MKTRYLTSLFAVALGAATCSACSNTAGSSAKPGPDGLANDTAAPADAAPDAVAGADTVSDTLTGADVIHDATASADSVAISDTTVVVPGATCDPFMPCGGVLEGKWTITGYCATTAAAGPDLTKFPACAGSGTTSSSTVTGDATFSNGTLSWKWEAKTSFKSSVSDACAAAASGGSATAQQLCDQGKGFGQTCAVTAGVCTCEWTATDSQPYYNGAYTVAGNDLVYAVSNIHDPYCVSGPTLQYLNSYRGKQFTLTRVIEGADAGPTADAGAADAATPADIAPTPDIAVPKDTIALDTVAVDAGPAFTCDILAKSINCPLADPPPPEVMEGCKAGLVKCPEITAKAFTCLVTKEVCTASGKHDDPATQALCKAEVDGLKICVGM